MKTISASKVEVGMELVEQGGALLTVEKIDTDPSARSFLIFTCKSLMGRDITMRVRSNRLVFVA